MAHSGKASEGMVVKRKTDGRDRVDVGAPIRVKPGEEMAGLEAIVAALESAVRAHPTPWFDFFDVWTSPVAAS